MSKPCAVCQHKDRTKIDKALMTGAVMTKLALDKGLTVDAVRRHKAKHIPATLVKYAEVLDELRAEQLVAEATKMFRAIETQIPIAAKANDHKAVAMLAGQGVKITALLMKRFDQMPPERSLSIVATVGWKGLENTILRALDPYPEAKRAVALALTKHSE